MDNIKTQRDTSITHEGGRKPFTSPSLKRFDTPRLTSLGRIDSVVLGTTGTGDDVGSSYGGAS
jgi:hypothetical protein